MTCAMTKLNQWSITTSLFSMAHFQESEEIQQGRQTARQQTVLLR